MASPIIWWGRWITFHLFVLLFSVDHAIGPCFSIWSFDYLFILTEKRRNRLEVELYQLFIYIILLSRCSRFSSTSRRLRYWLSRIRSRSLWVPFVDSIKYLCKKDRSLQHVLQHVVEISCEVLYHGFFTRLLYGKEKDSLTLNLRVLDLFAISSFNLSLYIDDILCNVLGDLADSLHLSCHYNGKYLIEQSSWNKKLAAGLIKRRSLISQMDLAQERADEGESGKSWQQRHFLEWPMSVQNKRELHGYIVAKTALDIRSLAVSSKTAFGRKCAHSRRYDDLPSLQWGRRRIWRVTMTVRRFYRCLFGITWGRLSLPWLLI